MSVQAAVTSGAGDVALGCAYALDSGQTSFLNPHSGQRTGPPEARLPLLTAGQDRFPRLSIDLRQVRSLARAVFVLYSSSGTAVTWAGALLISTQAGSRIDVPLEPAPAAVALAAVTLYQVEGEIVLRAERDPATSPREACMNFGYHTIAWLDDAHVVS
ncbi:hypothetical protein [Nocardioides sp. URHA0032]|uniref:hypothetical protein n=1 Tax=Nocardioides sp. URHA0032 TaxID=1380388 RepID=UPI0012DD245E|nr:hypothetical protein [Nocardioides sp. URHA0032]